MFLQHSQKHFFFYPPSVRATFEITSPYFSISISLCTKTTVFIFLLRLGSNVSTTYILGFEYEAEDATYFF
jgi:hypothetical protein